MMPKSQEASTTTLSLCKPVLPGSGFSATTPRESVNLTSLKGYCKTPRCHLTVDHLRGSVELYRKTEEWLSLVKLLMGTLTNGQSEPLLRTLMDLSFKPITRHCSVSTQVSWFRYCALTSSTIRRFLSSRIIVCILRIVRIIININIISIKTNSNSPTVFWRTNWLLKKV